MSTPTTFLPPAFNPADTTVICAECAGESLEFCGVWSHDSSSVVFSLLCPDCDALLDVCIYTTEGETKACVSTRRPDRPETDHESPEEG